jgi:type II restriction enzyme
MEFRDWIAEIANEDWLIYVKRLAGNDTGATKSNQVGVYVPKEIIWRIFPSMNTAAKNPECLFDAIVDSHDVPRKEVRSIWYNQQTRDEARITRWKIGVDYTPLQDVDCTGAIAVFAFSYRMGRDSDYLRAWVCRDLEEENFLEERIGGEVAPQDTFCDLGNVIFEGGLALGESHVVGFPDEWLHSFPSGAAIIQYLFENQFFSQLPADRRILKRRDHEFSLFRSVEHHHSFSAINQEFGSVDDFIKLANSISNRRKSRSGRSLELHLEKIFEEEGLTNFGVQCKTEGNKRPDFLFPNCDSYHDSGYPDSKLRMLAVKTTVKDRWRQILNEASRLDESYLFTLQQGVSVRQFDEMREECVKLVVPKTLHRSFPKSVRSELYTLSSFIDETKALYQ